MSAPARTTFAVLGDGGWGTALALHLHGLGHRVRWWGSFPDYLAQLDRRRANPRYLPGVRIPRGIRITPDLSEAVSGASFVIIAVPSQYLRATVRRLRGLPLKDSVLVSVAKGIERRGLKRMSQVIAEELGAAPCAVLSGPSIASEVATGHPASLVAAARSLALATRVQRACMGGCLRIYTSTDVTGVELGGALKNPIAIAAGVCDGLGLGNNSKAALITRGVAEMARLGTALGAKRETFWGLSGLGDLVTTCLSGRNRRLGERLGRGERLAQILRSTPMVIEGVDTARAALGVARRHGIELPIIEQVHAILFKHRAPRAALQALMRRAGKRE